MHPTIGRTRSLLWGTLLLLLMGGLAGSSQAQPPPPTILVPLGGTKDVQMTTKKAIKTAEAKREGVVSIRPVLGDPTTIRLIGQAAETTPLELTDEDGKKETYLVIVQRDVENLRVQLRKAIPTGNITVSPMTEGAVILTGTIARAADAPVIEQVVRALGFFPINQVTVAGVQQVQLDVVVAIVSRTDFRRMAFDFFVNSRNFFLASVTSGAAGVPATIGTSGALSTAASGLTGVVGAPNGAPTNILFGVLHNSWNFLGFLQALREEDLLKVMAEPKLITMSGQPASFLSGGEQAVPVPAGLGQVGVQFEEFGTRLNFLPIVLGNGRIHLEVEPEFSNLDPANGTVIQGTVVPGRDTNRIHTTVEMDVGNTFVLGGLIQHTVLASTVKLPILGDLPFVGTAFSRKAYQETEQEVLILVTPHLVEAFDCSQAPKYLPGQETRRPDDFELFLEGILEAPRGQRCVCEDGKYVPAYKHSPSASVFPCGEGCGNGNGCGGRGECDAGCGNGNGNGGCANGSCGTPALKPLPPSAPPATLPQATLPPGQPLPPIGAPQAQPITTPVTPTADTAASAPPAEPPAAADKPRPLPGSVLPPVGQQP
jgi:pilus assembly protein CpaC